MTQPPQTVQVNIEGMHCDNCARTVRTALEKVPGVQEVVVDVAAKQARVRFDPALSGAAALVQAVRGTGFQATGFSRV